MMNLGYDRKCRLNFHDEFLLTDHVLPYVCPVGVNGKSKVGHNYGTELHVH